MQKIYGANLEHVQAFVTGLCTTLSFLGSILVIVAYYIAKSKTNPKAARLIRNLAVADCIWFASVFIQAIFWIFSGPPGETGVVPAELCYILSPAVTVSRVSSLMWTCVVAFDVLESVTKRSWFSSTKTESAWDEWRYFIFVYVFSLPGGIASVAIHISNQSDFGCGAGYEPLGTWYEVLFYELAPILIGFLCNLYVFWKVRIRMGKRAFPLSVRKRRRRIMFNYIRVCIICWTPMMMFYFLEIIGVQSALLQVLARGLLYLTGFFNFLVFGMQDVYLKRSFQICIESLCCGFTFNQRAGESLMHKHLEKTVMFADENKLNADIIKDKKHLYRHHRLSREDKALLYKLRPDLNMKGGDVELEDAETDVIVADYGDQGVGDGADANNASVPVHVVGFADVPDNTSRPKQGRPKSPPPPVRDTDSDYGSDGGRWNSTDSGYSYDAENPMVSMPSVASSRSRSGSSQGSSDGRPKSALKKGPGATASPGALSPRLGQSSAGDQRNRSGGEFGTAITTFGKNDDTWFPEDPTESLLGSSRQNKYSSGSRSPARAPSALFGLVSAEDIDAASSSDDSDEEDDALYEALARTVSRPDNRSGLLWSSGANNGEDIPNHSRSKSSASNFSALESSRSDSNEPRSPR